MAKGPTPKTDHLRAMREANYAAAEKRRSEEKKKDGPAEQPKSKPKRKSKR